MKEILEKQGDLKGSETPKENGLLKDYRDRLDGIRVWVQLGQGTAEDRRLIEELEDKIRKLEGQK